MLDAVLPSLLTSAGLAPASSNSSHNSWLPFSAASINGVLPRSSLASSMERLRICSSTAALAPDLIAKRNIALILGGDWFSSMIKLLGGSESSSQHRTNYFMLGIWLPMTDCHSELCAGLIYSLWDRASVKAKSNCNMVTAYFIYQSPW